MNRFTCGHSAGVNANTTVPCAACALRDRLTQRSISHTISAAELAQTRQEPVSLIMEWTGSLYTKLLAAGFREGEITITLETKEG